MKKLRTRNHAVVLNRSAGGDTFIAVMMTILGILIFLPMYYTIIMAFKPMAERTITPPNFYVIRPTLQHFIDLFTNMNVNWVPTTRYIFNTLLITVGSVFGSLVMGSTTAYALSKIRFPGHKGLFWLIRTSLMISSTVTGITNFFIFVWLGWLNTYWISIVPVWASTLGLYLMKQFIDGNISDEMIEAARIDGAGEFRVYWEIVMPLVKPAWLTLMITTFQSVWGSAGSGYVWSENLRTFATAIGSFSAVSAGAGSAATILMMSVPIAVFVINQSKIVETMASSGMKD